MGAGIRSQVTLRLISRADAPDIQRYAADQKISKTSNIPYPYPRDEGSQFVERAIIGQQTGHLFAFAIQYEGRFAGVISLIGVDRAAGTASLGYWVAVPFWNKGVATAAAGQTVRYAFEVLGLSMLYSECLASNPASARVLEKNGFVGTGTYIHDGRSRAAFKGERMLRFRLDRSSWEK